MSLHMFGGGYLSCQESKSGNIKRLLLRFVVEKVNGKICVSCVLADTEKRSDEFVGAGNQRSRDAGGASFGPSTFIDPDP